MEFQYTNENGESLTMKQGKPFFLQRLDGTGNLRNVINTFRAPHQDGAFYISGSLEMRNITIEGTIYAESPAQAAILQKRLLRLFTPKARGTLEYRNASIPCVVEEIVFSAGMGARYPNYYISLLCPSPFFEALTDLRTELAAWISKFSFPLEIPETGIELGYREPSQIAVIDNIGDVACGCTIIFKALGTLSNPELMNVSTGELFRMNTTMLAGDEIRVNTHFAGKQVVQIRSGQESNAFKSMDIASTFIQLAPGRNTLRYNASENLDLLEVSIFYKPLFLGV